MLNMNDTDQSASPAEDKKNQEQSQLEPLPWEAGKGFLWGLPKTALLVMTQPGKTFSAPQIASILRVWLFIFSWHVIVYVSQYVYNYIVITSKSIQYIDSNFVKYALIVLNSIELSTFVQGAVRILIKLFVGDIGTVIIGTTCLCILLFISRVQGFRFYGCVRIICYASATSAITVLLSDTWLFMGYLLRMFIYFKAVKVMYMAPTWKAFNIAIVLDWASRESNQVFLDIFVHPIAFP